MRTRLLLLLCLMSFTSSIAQLNVWTGAVDDLWSNENNWTGTVPSNSDDVLIPSGFVVTIDSPANIRSIEVQGNSTLNITEALIIQNPSEFETNVVVNWSSGDLIGPGILLNSGTINLTFPSFDLSGSVVLNNLGTINLSSGANIGIGTDSVLNNSGTGTIDFLTTGSSIYAVSVPPNTLNNFGTIKTSFPNPSDSGTIGGTLINTDGIFQIDSGTLNLNTTALNMIGGEFNVAAGATLNWNGPIDAIGVITGNVFGTLNWDDDLSMTTNVMLQLSGNGVLTNTGGNIVGGGTLTNASTITFASGSSSIEDASTLDNNGLLTFESGADLRLAANCTLNNSSTGVIEVLSNATEIASLGITDDTRVFNNAGLITATMPNPSDTSSISITLNNDDGTIEVDNGTLSLNYSNTTLSNGTYNIASTGTLAWLFPISIEGNLTGNLEGTLDWRADLLVPTSATLDFTGNGFIDWITGDLDGGGVLNNETIIIKSSGGTKRIDNGSTLNNNGEIRQIVGGTISIGTNSILNNTLNGTIILEASSGFSAFGVAPNTLNNFGLIQSSAVSNNTFFSVQLSNSGTVDVVQDGMVFTGTGTFVNNETGVIKGQGSITLPVGFMNNGTVSPGASPGTLGFVNDYDSSATSILEIELNGSDQGVNYDLITINGNANLDGSLDVTLGFNPSINDEFVVLTTQNSINTCNLPVSLTSSFGGFNYDFDVVCRNNNVLVLTVINETLSTTNLEVVDSNVNVYPNPSNGIVHVKSNQRISTINLYDINGRHLQKYNTNTLTIDHLPNGLYFIEIKIDEVVVKTKKLIKI
ncbi:beta strand repeat-containing protein [Psychroserpens sp. XS_ASV72]|uniref:beta strand repeat-containing protein n=1 Tax=Psychroserpens sp. XS_ASV72 TaxID=3241293 RepID=UPI003515332F